MGHRGTARTWPSLAQASAARGAPGRGPAPRRRSPVALRVANLQPVRFGALSVFNSARLNQVHPATSSTSRTRMRALSNFEADKRPVSSLPSCFWWAAFLFASNERRPCTSRSAVLLREDKQRQKQAGRGARVNGRRGVEGDVTGSRTSSTRRTRRQTSWRVVEHRACCERHGSSGGNEAERRTTIRVDSNARQPTFTCSHCAVSTSMLSPQSPARPGTRAACGSAA